MRIPARLSRNGVKQFFDKVPGAKWEYWFRHEKENGLFELRVKGPFEKAYYSGEGLRQYLCAEGVYGPRDFDHAPSERDWLGPVRQSIAA